MRRAICLAKNGRGRVEPNPMVGCVLVKDGRVIGEGFHAHFGGAHAEPTALGSCTESPEGSTAYVTLEPCCHTNKKTPPCVPALIRAKLARVVVGCLDPNPDVNGKGLQQLREAGIKVVGPVLEAEARQMIAPFLARVSHKRPYVTMKWAQTVDGKVAGSGGRPLRITNAESDRVVHALRARCDAIAVGTNTVLSDDPLLTARGVDRSRPLLRVVLSNSLKIPRTSRIVTTAREHPLLVYTSQASAKQHTDVVNQLREHGSEVVALPDVPVPERQTTRFSLGDALNDLHARDVTHLLIEPGPTLTRYLFARGQADRVWVFASPNAINEPDAPDAPQVGYPFTARVDLAGDTLTEYLNPNSPVFFAPVPSADFVLARDEAAALRARSS
jgi:diaminohydroxyphosphoribosylaminopyrimidine deaminase/5-amino-6-(5-phosphoribosylamino)uracil reductase